MYVAKQHDKKGSKPFFTFLWRWPSLFIFVWFYVSCVHRWWKTTSCSLLSQHGLSSSSTSKTSSTYPFYGQVSKAGHIQVMFSKLWNLLRQWSVFRGHSFSFVNSIFFSLFAALVTRWSPFWKIISTMPCLLTLRTCIKAQLHCTTSDVLWALPAKACTGQGFLILVVIISWKWTLNGAETPLSVY